MTLDEIMALPVHPAAEVFPMLPDDELDELAADIKANGLHEPIVIKNGQLIDGRNRREGCRRASVEPKTTELNGVDPVAFIISKNINRRHLTKGQRAMAVAILYPDPAVLKRQTDCSFNLKEQKLEARLSQARTIVKWAPEMVDGVVSGAEHLDKAYETATQRKNAAEGPRVRLETLRKSAPDLADKVIEEQLQLDEAEGALKAREDRERREREELENVLLETYRRGLNSIAALSHPDFAAKVIDFFQRNPNRFKQIEDDALTGLDDITDAASIEKVIQSGAKTLTALISGGHDGKAD